MRLEVVCCECLKIFYVPDHTLEDVEGCTLNCPHCYTLLIMKAGAVQNFNEWLHRRDPHWPADGLNTHFIRI